MHINIDLVNLYQPQLECFLLIILTDIPIDQLGGLQQFLVNFLQVFLN